MDDVFEIFAVGLMATLFFTIPFAFFAFWRYLRYKETVALAERGLIRPTRTRNRNGSRDNLRWGIIIASIGMALSCGLWPIGFQSEFPLGLGPWMVVGFLPLFFGLGLVAIHYINRSEGHDEVTAEPDEEPIPPNKQQ